MADGRPRTRVLTVANQKGGVGKTTSTVNMAASLALHGLRVLVIDLDPQGNASTALAVPHQAGTPSIYEVLVEGMPLADVVNPVAELPGLIAAPATIDLAGAEIELVSLVARETRLQRALDELPGAVAAEADRIDYVLIDCPPSLGLLTVNAFVAAQEVLHPHPVRVLRPGGLGAADPQRRAGAGAPQPRAACLDDLAHHARRPNPAGLPGGRRSTGTFRTSRARHRNSSLCSRVGSPQLQPNRAHL